MTDDALDPRVLAVLERVDELPLPGDLERDEARPLADYPKMPTGTCYFSSRILAEIYPELTVVYGQATWAVPGTDVMMELDHVWNTRADGSIVDSTFDTTLAVADLLYHPSIGSGVTDKRGPTSEADEL